MTTYLELLQREGWFSIFQRKDKVKSFPQKILDFSQTLVPYISSCAAKRSTTIGLYASPLRNFTEIFSRCLGDRMNVFLPFLHHIFEPLKFGSVILDITAVITFDRENLKRMTLSKKFFISRLSGCTIRIILLGLEYYPVPRRCILK